jgi:hypothetical protein
MSQLIARAYKFWNYVPSLAAAVIFLLFFLVLTGLHTWKMVKTKTWFCISFTMGGVCTLNCFAMKISIPLTFPSRVYRLYRSLHST